MAARNTTDIAKAIATGAERPPIAASKKANCVRAKQTRRETVHGDSCTVYHSFELLF